MDNNYNFVRFEGVARKISNCFVTLGSNGSIGFNRGFCKKYDVEKYKYFQPYYDSVLSTIGFELYSQYKEQGMFKLYKSDGRMSVAVKSFLFDVVYESTIERVKRYKGRYQPEILSTSTNPDISDFFILKLEQQLPGSIDVGDMKMYPCQRCGIMRSKNEGGLTSAYCENC